MILHLMILRTPHAAESQNDDIAVQCRQKELWNPAWQTHDTQ